MYAEGSAAELLLKWVDNSGNESGFFIERSDQTGGSFVRIAVVRENTTSYIDSNLAPGATYCYRVQAFNEFAVSPYSNTACAVTTTVMAMESGSWAAVFRDEGDIVIQGVWVRDQISGQEKIIDVRLRWLPSSQTLGIVSATG